jgi:hypothetical protein
MLHNPMAAPTWNLQPGDILESEPTCSSIRTTTKRLPTATTFNGWDAAKQVFYYTARARGQNPWPRRHIAVREAKPSLPSI